jgi:hypothetical protein
MKKNAAKTYLIPASKLYIAGKLVRNKQKIVVIVAERQKRRIGALTQLFLVTHLNPCLIWLRTIVTRTKLLGLFKLHNKEGLVRPGNRREVRLREDDAVVLEDLERCLNIFCSTLGWYRISACCNFGRWEISAPSA